MRVANHLGVSMAFPRSLVLRMHSGRTHLQSGQPFRMHPYSDYNMGYLQPSLYLDVGSDPAITPTTSRSIVRGSLIR